MTLRIAIIFAILFTIFPSNLFDGDVGKLLMPFLGLFMAGVLPAISLTINSIKSGGYSVQRVQRMASELTGLLDFLQLVFVLALFSAIMLLVGEALKWGKGWPFEFYSSRIFNTLIGFSLGALIGALPKLRHAFRALIIISSEIAVDEASTKIKEKAAKMPPVIDRFPTSDKFGELFKANFLEDKSDGKPEDGT